MTKPNNRPLRLPFGSIGEWLLALVFNIGLAIFPVLFLYSQNVQETDFNEMQAPVAVLLLAAFITLTVSLIVLRSISLAGVGTAFFMLIFCNMDIIASIARRIFPFIKYHHLIILHLFAYITALFILRFLLNANICANINKLGSIAIIALLVMNILSAMPVELRKAKLHSQQSNANTSAEITDKRPNIYWLILDEYTNFSALKEFCGYDNYAFKDYLEAADFTVSLDSRNDFNNTYTVLTGILNMDYLPEGIGNTVEAQEMRNNSRLWAFLRENGYNLRGLGEWEFNALPSALGDTEHIGATTADGDSFKAIALRRTSLYPFISRRDDSIARQTLKSIDFFMHNKNYTPSNTMTMMHVSCPHPPYFFDENGNDTPDDVLFNFVDELPAHLAQLKFITKEAQKVIEKIKSVDPQSVIILQSDHSSRTTTVPQEHQADILNAVYYMGEPIDEIKGQSGLNTMIAVLNRVLGMDMPYREMPNHLAYDPSEG